MQIKCEVTLLFDKSGATIEITDSASRKMFFKGIIDSDGALRMLSGSCGIACIADVGGLNEIGKTMTHKQFEFKLPEHTYSTAVQETVAIESIKKVCPEEWIPDLYFGASNSFFYRSGELWARTTIRKYE